MRWERRCGRVLAWAGATLIATAPVVSGWNEHGEAPAEHWISAEKDDWLPVVDELGIIKELGRTMEPE